MGGGVRAGVGGEWGGYRAPMGVYGCPPYGGGKQSISILEGGMGGTWAPRGVSWGV